MTHFHSPAVCSDSAVHKGQFFTSADPIFAPPPPTRPYQKAFIVSFQLAWLQLLRQNMPSNWQLASCGLEQLAGIWGFPPHPTYLQPLTPDAIKDCSRLFPLAAMRKLEVVEARPAVDLVRRVKTNASQPSEINRVPRSLPPSIIAPQRTKSSCTVSDSCLASYLSYQV